MATTSNFSFASFVAYGNNCINNVSGNTPEMQTAFKADLKRAISHAGYPSKDEIGVIDEINDFEMTNTLEQVPALVAGYMKDEKRSFNIPSVDDNTTAASIKVVAVPEKTSTGVNQIGEHKGETYTSTTAAHEEVKVKNNRKPFKVK